MSGMYKVYDNVPLPPIKRARRGMRKYPLETMTVGQMIFVAGRVSKSVSAYISRISKDIPGKFTARHCWVVEDEDTVREVEPGTSGAKEGTGVWRIE